MQRATRATRRFLDAVSWSAALALLPGSLVAAQTPDPPPAGALPAFLRDRGPGQPISMFGTFIEKGELLVYPFVEYYLDDDAEYKPAELGFGLEEDYRGRYRATEGLLFLAYGFTDRLALEFEAAMIDAELEKSPDDSSSTPREIAESGLGDVEGQVRWRWNRETRTRPEFFNYFEVVGPTPGGSDKVLIGTRDWEFKLGTGMVRGYSWGTTTFRFAFEYDNAEAEFALGEYAVEYLRRLSPSWRWFAAIEGSEDELEFIPELQWRVADRVTVKLNSAFGLTSKATDWAPEFGILFAIPTAGS